MTNLRDELIDVAETAMDSVHDMDVTFTQYATAAADAILAAIKASAPPLVWSGSSANFAYCTLPFAQYQVREAESGYYVQVDGYMSQAVSDKHDTIDEAKAAANTDHVAQLTDWMMK